MVLSSDVIQIVPRKNMIILLTEDGEESIWGILDSEQSAAEKTEELKLSLKALPIVEYSTEQHISNVKQELSSLGITGKVSEQIILEGLVKTLPLDVENTDLVTLDLKTSIEHLRMLEDYIRKKRQKIESELRRIQSLSTF